MFKLSAFIISILCLNLMVGQNLVPNPSFETYTACPSTTNQVPFASPWFSPSSGSPDYFNSCTTSSFCDVPNNFFGVQNARTGNAYVHCVTYPSSLPLREYVTAQLSSQLVAGQVYDVSFYVSLQDNSYRASNNIGAYISTTAPITATSLELPFVPQINETNIINDDVNWTLINGTYTASGGEEYITIGNFYNDVSTSTAINPGGIGMYATFYLIDDVCITPVGGSGCNPVLPVTLLSFTAEVEEKGIQTEWVTQSEINNDYFTLEKSKNAEDFVEVAELKGAGTQNSVSNYTYFDTDPYFGTSYYRLKQTDFDGTYTYSSVVPVTFNKEQKTKVYFTEGLVVEMNTKHEVPASVIVFDATGRKVFSNSYTVPKGMSKKKFTNQQLSQGIYFVRIQLEHQTNSYKIFKN